MTSGATAALRINGRRLAPSLRDNSLPLAPTSQNRVDIAALRAADSDLDWILGHIDSPEAFLGLFSEAKPPSKSRRPLSRGMAPHRDALLANTVCEHVMPCALSPTWFPLYLALWLVIFLVPKKNGTGRLVVDARPVNSMQRAPPPMRLPRIHDAIAHILSFQFAAKTDGVSYFYQFPLHPTIRGFFKVRLAGTVRRAIYVLQMLRMPMGRSWRRLSLSGPRTSWFAG